jgi:AraC-like DNA-binding protein
MQTLFDYYHIVGGYHELVAGLLPLLDRENPGMLLCVRGEASLVSNGMLHPVVPNSLVIYTPQTVFQVAEWSEDFEGYALTTEIGTIQGLLFQVSSSVSIFTLAQHPVRHISEEQADILLQYIHLMRHYQKQARQFAAQGQDRLWQLNQMQGTNVKNALILHIISLFAEENGHTKNALSRGDQVVMEFFNLLNNHFREHHEVGFYADALHLSIRYFSSMLQEHTGQSASQWIGTALLNEAKRLLVESAMSVKQVSDVLHFPSQSYFGKWFKTKTGLGPLQFKRATDSAADVGQLSIENVLGRAYVNR